MEYGLDIVLARLVQAIHIEPIPERRSGSDKAG